MSKFNASDFVFLHHQREFGNPLVVFFYVRIYPFDGFHHSALFPVSEDIRVLVARGDLLPRASQLHIDVHLVPLHAAADFASRFNLFAQPFLCADGRQPASKEVLSKVTQCDKGNGKKVEGNTVKW